MTVNIKRKRLLIRLAFHTAALVLLLSASLLAQLIGSPSAAAFFTVIFLGYAITMRANPLPGRIERRLVVETECPNCGETFDLVNNWSCGCGYVTWEPRHAFSPCPHCKKVFTWLVCPTCEGSIRI